MKSAYVLTFLALGTLLVHALDSEMDKSMKQVARASKELKADLALTDDTKHNKDADLKDVATMKTGAQAARPLVPKKVKAMPADQQAAQTADFQKDMDAFIADIDTLNADITAEKWAPARADFQKLMDDEKAGHKKFRVPKK